MRHGRGDDVGMLRLVLSRLRSLGLAQHDRVNGASLRGPEGPLFHRCSADAEHCEFCALRRYAWISTPSSQSRARRGPRACGARKISFSFLTRHLFLIPARRDSETYRATIRRPWRDCV
jgi:hypothetical protein